MKALILPLLLVVVLPGCGPDPAEMDARLKAEFIANCEQNMANRGPAPGKLGSFCQCWHEKAHLRFSNKELVDGITGPGPKPKDMADEIKSCALESR